MATPVTTNSRGQKMQIFAFYLDEPTKLAVEQRLSMLVPDAKKETMAALLRVLLREFVALPFDDASFTPLQEKLEAEYVYSTKKNKRSKL